MKYLLIAFLITLISCSYTNQPKETTKLFTLDEVKSSGFKERGEFQTEFKDSEVSTWGFYKGREVAFIMYPSVDLANSSGLEAAQQQTEKIEITERNIGHGPNVEKLACRGYKPGVGVSGRGGLKLNSYSQSAIGLNGTLIINKSNIFLTNDEIENNAPPCVRREPLYTHYKIYGNLVIMAEPLTTEDENDTADFIEKLASKLIE